MDGGKSVEVAGETAAALPVRRSLRGVAAPRADEASTFARLAIIRLPLIVLVVCYHNEAVGQFVAHLHHAPALQYVVDLIANGFGGIRMPVFFLIAGYVLFRNRQPGLAWFVGKIRSRARSLLLPLVLWSLLWLAIIGLAQQLPWTSAHFSGGSIWSMKVVDISLAQLALAVVGPNADLFLYHLWFLRDLFTLVLLSPLIYAAIRLSRGWASLLMLVVWLLDVNLGMLSKDAVFYFFVGSHLAIARRSIFAGDLFGPWAIACWVAMKALGGELSMPETKLWIVCGTLGTLYLSGLVEKLPEASKWLQGVARYSFFVFVAHEPLLTVVRRLYIDTLEPTSAAGIFMAYGAIVTITVLLLVAAFRVAERIAPRGLDVMTGGRAA